jgi:LysM domain
VVAVMHLPVKTEDEGQELPHLALVPAGRLVARPAPSVDPRAVYRRRRLVVAAGLVAVVFAAALGLRAVLAGPGGGSLSTAGSSGAPIPAAAHIHVVQQGETLWSIALASAHGGDPRPMVDQLQQQLGGHALWVGQHLLVP